MNWLLDADVLSQPAKRFGDPRVVAWLEAEKDACYTSSVVIAQLAYWVKSKDGKSREALQLWLTRLVDAMHGRIHGFNAAVAHVWAEQEGEVAEWSNVHDWKSGVPQGTEGSNPSLSANFLL
jgi:predicted nucleic acid-binding protein